MVHPAQGTALGIVGNHNFFIFGPTGQWFAVVRRERLARWADHPSTHNKNLSGSPFPQGVALG
jgi:hypothetical protein